MKVKQDVWLTKSTCSSYHHPMIIVRWQTSTALGRGGMAMTIAGIGPMPGDAAELAAACEPELREPASCVPVAAACDQVLGEPA